MNGRDLLEAMSFLDEELVAASDTAPRVIPWKRILTLAACLCIVLLGAFSLTRISPREQIKEASADSFSLTEAASQMDAGQPETSRAEAAPEEAFASEAASIRVRIEELTDKGFRGTALEAGPDWNQGDSIQMEYAEDYQPDALILGAEYLVWVESFDPDTLCATVSRLEPIG